MVLSSPQYKSDESKYNNSIQNLQSNNNEMIAFANYKSMNWQKGLSHLYVDETKQYKKSPTL